MGHTLQSVDMTPPGSPSIQPTLWRTCRVVANRKRLQTLALLIRKPNQTVSAVAERMRLSVPAASQYLRALEARGLLTCRRVVDWRIDRKFIDRRTPIFKIQMFVCKPQLHDFPLMKSPV